MSDLPPAPAKSRRWALYVSLFVNVALLTALALGAWRVSEFRDRMAGAPAAPWMPRQIERALPEDSRGKVRAIREAHHGELRDLVHAVRRTREDVRAAFDAEPFDADALRGALEAMRKADDALAVKTGALTVEIAAALTPEERAMVRERLKKGPDERERRSGREERAPSRPD